MELVINKQTEFKILKADPTSHVVYGYAMISQTSDERLVEDSQGHTIEPQELEQTAFNFISDSRRAGEMHQEESNAEVVASVVFTPELMDALKIAKGILPVAWLIGVRVFDEELFEKVKSGALPMFSIQGQAMEEVA